MKIRVVEEFALPGRTLPVGHVGEVVNLGRADGLPGVEDGAEVFVVRSPTPLSPNEKLVMRVIGDVFPEAREHEDEGVALDYVPASHVEVVE